MRVSVRHDRTSPHPRALWQHMPEEGLRKLRVVGGGGETDSPTSAPALSQRSDDELMLLARGGVTAAFEMVVARHQGTALRVALKQLGAVAAAKDAAQSAFVEIFRGLERYRPMGRFRVFLCRIVLNQCRMAQRTHRYDRRVREELARLDSGERPPWADEQILARERSRELDRALAKISPRLRTALILRYSAELSLQETAEVLGVPLGTVKSRVFEGLRRLRQHLHTKDGPP